VFYSVLMICATLVIAQTCVLLAAPAEAPEPPSNVFSVPQALFHAHEGGAEREVGQSTTSEGVKGSNEFILEDY
jgi:hypothetical protein